LTPDVETRQSDDAPSDPARAREILRHPRKYSNFACLSCVNARRPGTCPGYARRNGLVLVAIDAGSYRPRTNIMGVILATFLFAMVSVGFTLLMVIPVVFLWLAVAALAGMVSAPEPDPEPIERRPLSTSVPRVAVARQEALTPGDHLVRA
jgi:hypothetical protein